MIPTNYNGNTTIILIPNNDSVDTVGSCRPIANFKFMIITKILSDTLASIMPSSYPRSKEGPFKVGSSRINAFV